MIRVLHVVENFDGQAVESWLARVVTCDDFADGQFQFDFFLLGIGAGKCVGPLLERGGGVHQGNPGGASLPQMAKALRRHVRAGSYDIVHIHQDVMAGVFAFALLGTGVRIITHVHNCWQRLPVGGVLKERVLTALARQLTLRLSHAIVGVSRQALAKMLDRQRGDNRMDQVIYCSVKGQGVRLRETDRVHLSAAFRHQCGWPPSTKIMLFLGRLDDYKNPIFALDILIQMINDGTQDACLIIAGVGGLDGRLQELVARHGLHDRVRLVGWVDDPTDLLLASDLLLMPSQELCGEGLGLAAVEAQGYGLPVLCSLSIPEDAAIIPDLFKRLPLSDGVKIWASAANESLRRGKQDVAASMTSLEQSPFTDAASYAALAALYDACAAL